MEIQRIATRVTISGVVLLLLFVGALNGAAQTIRPIVAVHDSEGTRALASMPAVSPTPTGPGRTGYEWWVSDWAYFTAPEALKEVLRSDGTAFEVVSDADIAAGRLLTNGVPRYPIVISLASEAIGNDQIAQWTNYVAAGGFLFVGSSAFTRNLNGTTRGDFAISSQLGLRMTRPGLTNWVENQYLTKVQEHRLVSHLPSGQLIWRMPAASEETNWGTSPNHKYRNTHELWNVTNLDATVLAQGDASPYIAIKAYGRGYFIYHGALQPLIGHGGFAPTLYSYMIFRNAIEWAFESAGVPIPKVSPWPYQYDAAFMVRHDFENYADMINLIEASSQVEYTNGAKGDYYFCTGTLREDMTGTSAVIASLRRAISNYGATIGPHNGGLRNPNNPTLTHADYDYWHWGPDEALDVTPPNYPSGKSYAFTSMSNSFVDIETWLSGQMTSSMRLWVGCYFNATREDSYDIQEKLNVKVSGEQKLGPFPHWVVSTRTPNKRYSFSSQPPSDWFVGGLVAQSLEPWHPPGVFNTASLRNAMDYYYNLGALLNFYSHTASTGQGAAGALALEYVRYGMNTNLHPRLWAANASDIYQWWSVRSNVQVTASFATNGNFSTINLGIRNAQHTNTAVEAVLPFPDFCGLQVTTNGVAAGDPVYRAKGRTIRVRVGQSVTNVSIGFYPQLPGSETWAQNFDAVAPPNLPAGWSTSASGAQGTWLTVNSASDTAPNSAFTSVPASVGVNELVSAPITLSSNQSQLSFRHSYDLESGAAAFDGGVLEIKIGSASFTDIVTAGGTFLSGGYNALVDSVYQNPLANRLCWSGNSGGFVTTSLTLPASVAGQTVQFRWRCGSDNGNASPGWFVDSVSITESICLCCQSTNTAPVLPSQNDRTIVELTGLTVTNTAFDADLPANALSYELLTSPSGAAISGGGVITWTPDEAAGPSTNVFVTKVTDNGNPPLSSMNTFTVFVTETNSAPLLPSVNGPTIAEMSTLRVTNTASDSDLPQNTLTYSLLEAPAGAQILASGVIEWTPGELNGPGTFTFRTRVTDNGQPARSATNSFQATVTEVNGAPTLPSQQDRAVVPLATLQVTNTGSDADIPANLLTYTLASAPAGASISSSGVISWTPTLDQNNTTNLFRTVVADNGTPVLSATNTFSVVVMAPRATIEVDTASLVSEACFPTNGAVDPGEPVMILLALKNTGTVNTTNLVATLLATNGVVSNTSPQGYGILTAGGGSVGMTFALSCTNACGTVANAVFALSDGGADLGTVLLPLALGKQSTVMSESFDSVVAPALPAGWTTSASGSQSAWVTQSSQRDTLPNAAFAPAPSAVGINELVSGEILLPLGQSRLSFRHSYNLEVSSSGKTGYDAGVLEIQIGTNSFLDIAAAGGTFVTGGYDTTVSTSYSNPLAGRPAWSGSSGGFVDVAVDLPAAAEGQTIRLRWRCGTDSGGSPRPGWWLDSVSIAGVVCCANDIPVLASIPDRTINEHSLLTVTNTAMDLNSGPGELAYSLEGAPEGATIDTNGVISWVPSEAQGPSTNIIRTIVTDSANPPLSATNQFTVFVTEVNSAPVLPSPADVVTPELALVSVTNTAMDADLPPDQLSYELLNAPDGAEIDTNGIIRWIPSEAQGPGTNLFQIVVTDAGTPALSATNQFTVVVTEVPQGPVLVALSDLTTPELSLVTVSNIAVQADVPLRPLSYLLQEAPAGAFIDAVGTITWIPTEEQGPSTNVFRTIVADAAYPTLSATNQFTVIVTEVNTSPVLLAHTNLTTPELVALTVTNTASDPDLPVGQLTYQLLAAPEGASIDTNGVITWTPGEAQGPGTNVFRTVVADSGDPSLSATNEFSVIVTEVNVAPVLPDLSDLTVFGTNPLMVTNTATDSDLPANLLAYELIMAPTSATIDSAGVIHWTPTPSDLYVPHTFTTVVTDSSPEPGVMPLSATNSFQIAVFSYLRRGPTLPLLSSQTIYGTSPLVVYNTAYYVDHPPLLLTYTLRTAPTNAAITTNGIISWTPDTNQVPGTYLFTTEVTDGGDPPLSSTNTFLVYVQVPVSPEVPIIQSVSLNPENAVIAWSSLEGRSYRLEYSDEIQSPNWQPLQEVVATGNLTTSTNTTPPATVTNRFFRVVLLP